MRGLAHNTAQSPKPSLVETNVPAETLPTLPSDSIPSPRRSPSVCSEKMCAEKKSRPAAGTRISYQITRDPMANMLTFQPLIPKTEMFANTPRAKVLTSARSSQFLDIQTWFPVAKKKTKSAHRADQSARLPRRSTCWRSTVLIQNKN